jgi:hypothetical protein
MEIATGTSEVPPNANEGGPARRTRAATKSPQKAQPTANSKLQVRRPRQLPNRIPPIDANGSGVGATAIPDAPDDAPAIPKPPTPPPAGEDDLQSSPLRVPRRNKRLIAIPAGLVGYSQPKSDEEYYEEDDGIIQGAFGVEDNDLDDQSPDRRAAQKRYASSDHELSSEDDFEGESYLLNK